MRNAFYAAALVSVILGVMSFFVVTRQLSFISVGVAHSAFGGVALGVLLGINPVFSAVVFALLVANAIGAVARSGRLKSDASIGIFFAFTMALGVIFIGLSKQYNTDLFGYLFGNILAITKLDLALMVGAGVLVLGCIVAFFKELLFTSFDSELARAAGMPTTILDHLLLTLVGLSVVIGLKMIGIVLVTALLVLPTASAMQVARRYTTIIALSVAIALADTIGGLMVSYWADLASGATIVTMGTAVFFVFMIIGRMQRAEVSPNE